MTESIRNLPTSNHNSTLLEIRYGRPEIFAAVMLRLSEASLVDIQNNSRPIRPTTMNANIVMVIVVNCHKAEQFLATKDGG
jgi:hypothetical protein